MAQLSYPWPLTAGPIIGDGRDYTSAEWDQGFEILFQQMDAANVFVLLNVWNDLAVTAPGANQIQVATGAAMGKGHVYWNDAALNLVPGNAPGGQTRDDAVILETDWLGGGATAQYTTRIVLKTGAMGAPPAMTQIDNTLWQNRLANFTIDDVGAITGLTDFREYCQFASLVVTDMLEDLAVTTAKIANDAVTAAKIPVAVAGNGLGGAGGAPLIVNVDTVTIEINADTLRVKAGGIDNAHLGNDAKWMKGHITPWSGTMGAGPDADFPIDPDTALINPHWHICNGDIENGVQTPDLRDQFVLASGPGYAPGAAGGAATHLHAVALASDLGGNHDHGAVTGVTLSVDWYTQIPNEQQAATAGHTHPISASGQHQHGVNGNTALGSTMPPYYTLVWLCYVG